MDGFDIEFELAATDAVAPQGPDTAEPADGLHALPMVGRTDEFHFADDALLHGSGDTET